MSVRAIARGPSKPMCMSLVSTSSTSLLLGRAGALVVPVLGVAPRAEVAPVVEARLAVERQLHLAVHAADHAQEDVGRVVVGRRAALRLRPLGLVPPRTDDHDVAHDDPAVRRSPARLEDHRPGEVAARRRHLDVGRAEAKAARVAVEDGAEDAGRVDPRQAQPLDVSARRDECGRLAIGEEGVLPDRWER